MPFAVADLPFMDPAAAHADAIPFDTLLQRINDTHRRGLQVEAEDGGAS